LAFANFLVWRLRTGACGVGACGFWRYRMPPRADTFGQILIDSVFRDAFNLFAVSLGEVNLEEINFVETI